jgi:hypothetical protein
MHRGQGVEGRAAWGGPYLVHGHAVRAAGLFGQGVANVHLQTRKIGRNRGRKGWSVCQKGKRTGVRDAAGGGRNGAVLTHTRRAWGACEGAHLGGQAHDGAADALFLAGSDGGQDVAGVARVEGGVHQQHLQQARRKARTGGKGGEPTRGKPTTAGLEEQEASGRHVRPQRSRLPGGWLPDIVRQQ